MDNAQQIVDAAIKLTPAERVKLVDAVLDSIPAGQPADGAAHGSDEFGKSWGLEIERRKAEARAGSVKLVSKSEAIPGPRDDG